MTDTTTPEQQVLAQREYELLLQEANDRCAQQISRATAVNAADSALRDLRFRIRRLDSMSMSALLGLANERTARQQAH